MMPRGPRDIGEDAHLSVDHLAALAEGGVRSEEASVTRHLARCRSCMAAYADAVRYRAAWLASPGLFETPPVRPTPTARAWQVKAARPLLAAGLLMLFGWGGYLVLPRPQAVPGNPQPIASVLEQASSLGLVYPGGEAGAAPTGAPYRSGAIVRDGAQRVLDSLLACYERTPPRSSADLYLFSSALAAGGRMDLARDYVAEAREARPGDPRFLVLAAIIARHDEDHAEAEALLREARQLAPRDLTVALDLGIVLAEKGARAEAESLLREVSRRVPRSAMALRADRTLEQGASR